jgi:hypothetical protein
VPEGEPETASRASGDLQAAIDYQNRTAATLARAGYRIRQLPRHHDAPSPDFDIEGRTFDCYTPKAETAAESVRSMLRNKAKKAQASRFVVNLDRSRLEASDIRRRLLAFPPSRVREVLVLKNGIITRIWP